MSVIAAWSGVERIVIVIVVLLLLEHKYLGISLVELETGGHVKEQSKLRCGATYTHLYMNTQS